MKKYIVIQILGDEEISELDLETRDTIPGWLNDGEEVDCAGEIWLDKDGLPFQGYQTVEGEWMSIERLEELLNEFKKKGATHVAMEHHCDHHGYMFDYGTLRVATEKDVLEEQMRKEEKKKSINAQRIAELKKEIEKLEKE